MFKLILGSNSPRRKEILTQLRLPFRVITPNYDEEALPFDGDPQKYVEELSRGKSRTIQENDSKEFILTADTTVYRAGKIYGKPRDRKDAERILTELNGKSHSVYTGVSLRKGEWMETLSEVTEVHFDHLAERELQIYLDKVEWHDKAGAYAIQGEGAMIVKGINGCYYNVKGLPLGPLKKLFLKFGMDLWDII